MMVRSRMVMESELGPGSRFRMGNLFRFRSSLTHERSGDMAKREREKVKMIFLCV